MRVRTIAILGLMLAAAVGAAAAERAVTSGAYEPLGLYTKAATLIHDDYVEPLSWGRLMNLGVRGMVGALDANSELLTPQQSRELPATAAGDIGVDLSRRDHVVTVMTAIDGMPAAAAGIEAGDKILKIDGADTAQMQPIDARDRLRGAPGSTVVLTILRDGEPREVRVTRAETPLVSVADREVAPGMLYVRIRDLDRSSPDELRRLLATTSAEKARGLVLDLRDSPGRDVQVAVEIAGILLGRGKVVAEVDGRTHGQPPAPVVTSGDTDGRHVQIAVLVDRGTVSAAEILAGALHDSGHAVIVGVKTAGDATKQLLIPLSDGSVLRLTTARYLTPNGRAIDGAGITPDVVVAMPPKTNAASAGAPPATDPQLAVAVDIVKAASLLGPPNGAGMASAPSRAPRARSDRSDQRPDRVVWAR